MPRLQLGIGKAETDRPVNPTTGGRLNRYGFGVGSRTATMWFVHNVKNTTRVPINAAGELASVSPLLKRLVAVAEEDNRRLVELCDAVLRHDWEIATTLAEAMSRHRGPSTASSVLPKESDTVDGHQKLRASSG